MQVTITAIGPDNRGLADPIVHYVTSRGANIHEIQMYDHDIEKVFAMLMRIEWPAPATISELRHAIDQIAQATGLEIRVWSSQENATTPRLALCTTYRPEPAIAVMRAIRDGRLNAEVVALIGNRPACRGVAEQFGVPFEMIGDASGNADNDKMVRLIDGYKADYIVLARYMRMIPASTCWRYAGGRILNLHHGLLPSFPGPRPYEDAFARHMLVYGATVHFIVPELDAGNQIVHQGAFSVFPGTPLLEIKRVGEEDNEPACLVEGLRRVVNRAVELQFHRVVLRKPAAF